MNRLALTLSFLLAGLLRAEEPRRDRFGDPLPQGAIARLGTIHTHPNASAIRFSADGQTVVTTGHAVVRHWDAESGRVRRVIARQFEQEGVWQVISADGRIAANAFGDRVEVHDIEKNKLLHRVPVPRLKELGEQRADLTLFAISPHGDLVLLRIRDSEDVVVIRDGQIETWTGVPPGYVAPFFSDDGTQVAIWAHHEGKMSVAARRAAAGAAMHKIDFPGYFLALAPDGSSIVGFNSEKVFGAKAGRPAADWDLKVSGNCQAACFSGDGRRLAVGTDREVALWDVPAKKLVWKSPLAAKALTFSPDGGRLAGIDQQLRVWDVKTGKALSPDFGPHAQNLPSTPLPNRFVVTSTVAPHRLHVWDWGTGTLRFSADFDAPPSVAWLSADGTQLHAYRPYLLASWDIATQKLLRELNPTPTKFASDMVTAPRPTPDGRFLHMLAPNDRDKKTHTDCTLIRWDMATARVIERRPIKLPEFRHAEFTPDAWGIYSRLDPDNHEVPGRITDARTGQPRLAATWAPPAGMSAWGAPVVSLNGRAAAIQIFSWDMEPRVHETVVLDSATGKPLMRVPAAARQTEFSTEYNEEPKAFSPDGRWLAVAHHSGIELRDLVEQKAVPFHPPHLTPDSREGSSRCEMLAFVSNEHLLARYDDANILIWELPAAARRPPAVRLSATTWNELSNEDPGVALRAVWALKSDPKAGLDLLRRLKPAVATDENAIAALYADLASNKFGVRDSATKRLRELGHAAGPFLTKAQPTNAEQKRRTQPLLDAIRAGGPVTADERRAVHAVHAAELIGGDAARALLAEWARGDPAALLTRDAKASVKP